MSHAGKGGWKVRLLIFVGLVVFLWLLIKFTERRQLYYPMRGIEMTPEGAGLKYEDVYFATSDGVKLNGWLMKADSSRGVALFCHGNAGNISHRFDTILILRQMDLDVFIFDYRGYGRSGGFATERGLYLDTQAAYEFLIKEKKMAPRDIVLFGRSIGGNVAIDLASRHEAACLISESAFSSIEDMAKSIYGVRPPRWLLSNHFDALSRIKEVNLPKLIIHSRDDEIVPFQQGQMLFDAAKEPKEFFELVGSHNEAFLRAGRAYHNRLREFIDKHLPEHR
jgi:fermentation-respiration switch protein FrsA (DUF1100 family)